MPLDEVKALLILAGRGVVVITTATTTYPTTIGVAFAGTWLGNLNNKIALYLLMTFEKNGKSLVSLYLTVGNR